MIRYALAFALCLLVVPALAQTPNPAQLQQQLRNVQDQLEAAQADRAATTAMLDRFKAAVKELQQVVQTLNQQVMSAKADATKKDTEISDLRRQLGAEKTKAQKLEQATHKLNPVPNGKPAAQGKGK